MTQGIQAMVKGQFLNPVPLLADMSGDAVADLITAAADVVLILDHEGIIRDMALGSEDMLESGCQHWLGKSWVEVALLAGSVIIVMIVELLNTGIETAIDRIGPEWHALSKRAKDMGSAAVLLSLLLCGGIWAVALWHHFF